MIKSIDSIYEEIRDKIIYLELPPNTKIREEDLAEEYKISRTPIRGIISRLVQDKLLIVAPQKGTFVTKININEIHDYIFIRKSVELAIIKIVAEVATDEDLDALMTILDEQKTIAAQEPSIDKSIAFYKTDNEFHRLMFKIAGEENVWNMVIGGVTPLNRARIMANLRDSERVMAVYEQHRKIVDMLKAKDNEAAIKAYDEHLDRGFDGLNPVIEQYKDYFVGGDN